MRLGEKIDAIFDHPAIPVILMASFMVQTIQGDLKGLVFTGFVYTWNLIDRRCK